MFKPGQSGNPGGRKPIPKELKEKLTAEGSEVVQFWIDSYKDTKLNWSYRNKAGENIMAYAFGKPKEILDMNIDGRLEGVKIEIVKHLDSDN